MLVSGDWTIPHFHSGGLNFYLPLFAAKLDRWLLHAPYNPVRFIFLARVLAPGILSSASIFWQFFAAKRLFPQTRVPYIVVVLFSFSPLVLGESRIFYPHHYIIFFASAVLYFLAAALTHEGFVQRRYFILAGATAGLTASVKYTGSYFVCLQS